MENKGQKFRDAMRKLYDERVKSLNNYMNVATEEDSSNLKKAVNKALDYLKKNYNVIDPEKPGNDNVWNQFEVLYKSVIREYDNGIKK